MVSIIIPNYNHAPYLKERIESILNQTYQDFEIILLDDCSTDNSREVLEHYRSNPHVSHIVLNEQNTRNTFLQWDRGVRLSRGEYLWMAESDDVAEPTFIEVLVRILEQHPEAVVAYSHSMMIDSRSQPLGYSWHSHGSNGRTYVYQGNWFLKHRMLVYNHIYNASMAVFRRSAYYAVPPSFQQYRYCGDYLFWNYLCTMGKVIEVQQVLNRYRQHERKVSMDSQKNGGRWRDIGGILTEFSDMLHLSPLQRRCLRGRWTKRFNKENGHSLTDIRQEYSHLYGGSRWDICCYEVGKLLGFLRNT